jgi:ATP-dependent DNA ligase
MSVEASVVAKKLTSCYRPGERGWLKIKNSNYWRRDAEREAMALRRERGPASRLRLGRESELA